MDNQEVIQKAITAADALASAGKLNPQQANKFLDYVVDESVLKGNARIERVTSETWEINKIGVGKRVAMAKAEAKDPGLRRNISTGKITLTPRELIVPIEVGDIFKEINVEKESVVDHILQIFGRALANDLEELVLNGNALGHAVLEGDIIDGGSATQYVKDTYLALQDGWMKLAEAATVNQYPAGGSNIGASIFSGAIQKMPTKFRKGRRNMRFIMGSDMYQKWLEKLSARATVEGDNALSAAAPNKPVFGVPMLEVPLLDLYPTVTKHIVLNALVASSLGYAPVLSGSEAVLPSTLSSVPTAKYSSTADYAVDYTAGTIARIGGTAIADGATVKVTFQTYPRMLLTPLNNLLLGIGRDIRVEKGRDIFKGVDQFVITAKVACAVEEDTALVHAYNIGAGV